MASVAQYLVTLNFIDEFNLAIAQAYTIPEDRRPAKLWDAEVEGYKSVLHDLYQEALDFELQHLHIYERKDGEYHAMLNGVMQDIIGIGETSDKALTDLRLKLEAAFD